MSALDSRVHWFRYEDQRHERGPYIHLVKLPVLRETQHCVYLDYYSVEKRVLKIARKRFAYPTIELAQNSFKIRKSWQERYAQRTLDHVQAVRKLIESGRAWEQESKQFDLVEELWS